jgi:hypothetical protein
MAVNESGSRNIAFLDEYRRATSDRLKSGDGGGTFDGMEPRVARLEDDMKEIKSDLKAIRNDLSYLRGKVDSMPTTLQLLGFVIAVLAIAGLAKYFAP